MPVLGAAILLAALCFIKPPGGSPADVPIHRSDFLLNTFVDIAIYDSRDESILDGAMALCREYENRFSRTLSGSEVYRLNHREDATGTYPLSDDMTDLLATALYCCERSGGAFDITTEPLSSLWNFSGTSPSVPPAEAIEEARKKVDYKKLRLDGTRSTLTFLDPGTSIDLGAIAKGSGMIHPNMATMLLFITTDAKVEPAVLQAALSSVVPATFNQISVDGDTSTNDTVLLLASGLSGAEIAEGTPDYDTFVAALTEAAEHLSRELAGDGEGATKLLECTVTGAPDLATARAVSKSVIHSTLFKAAMFGADANWGRVLCAIGYTPGDFDISKTSVRLKSKAGEVFVCENAAYHPYSEDEAAVVLKEDEIDILVDLGSGDATAKAWGCDLTYDYVKINGDYRT